MRVGPLADTRIIDLLNRFFVPVYAVNEDYSPSGPVASEEKAEYQRIYRTALAAGLSTGTVHVYLLTPDGTPFDSLHVAEAAKTERLIALLEKAVRTQHPVAGKPLVPPAPQCAAPVTEPGALVLHLTARPLSGGGSWPGVSENWIVLSANEVAKLLPPAEPSTGSTWLPEATVVAKLLRPFYPVTENNDLATNRIDHQELKATVLSANGGRARAWLEGRLRMKHNFYPGREDGNFVEATVAGYADIDLRQRRLATLRLVTDQATYGGGTFAVALRSLP
jgi:hypothetical protein